MKFTLPPTGWVRGAVTYFGQMEFPAGKPPELWKAAGLIPPLESCADDLELAVLMWKNYPHCAHRLVRRLNEADQIAWDKLLPTLPRG